MSTMFLELRNGFIKGDQSKYLEKDWKWKTSKGTEVFPRDMNTGHLFNTLKLIWNHLMPLEAKITPYKHYNTFDLPLSDPQYTVEYMVSAIKHIGTELMCRNNLTSNMINDLSKMEAYLLSLKKLQQPCLLG